MKGALAILGVVVVGAVAYFIAKGKGTPTTTSGKSGSGNSVSQQVQKQLATNLLTSQNMSALSGLVTSVLPNGGSAKVATPAGPAGSGTQFITEDTINPKAAPASAPTNPGLDGLVVSLDDQG